LQPSQQRHFFNVLARDAHGRPSKVREAVSRSFKKLDQSPKRKQGNML
jgi:hypothetical protein